MRLWSKLEPWEWRDELARVHPDLTEGCLIACGRAVPELAARIKAQESKEGQVRVVLRYFGDEGHRQPEGEVRWGPAIDGGKQPFECPRWERLPPLEDGARATVTTDGGKRRGPSIKGYDGAKVEIAVRTLRPGDDPPRRNQAAARAGLPTSAVDRILVLMKDGKLAPAPSDGWLVIQGKMAATPPLIFLAEL